MQTRQSKPVSFPNWKEALAASALAPDLQSAYTREILGFLKQCKERQAAATVELAKEYLVWRERQPAGPAREALRWFYRQGRAGAAPQSMERSVDVVETPRERPAAQWRKEEPPEAGADLGGADWERDLIKAARERGFLWRTEQTYREWAVRFARFIAPQSPYAASGEDVAAFLSALAVQGRASPSAQKQALNALVFLMQEALHRDLGQMRFERAAPKQRLPTVLSVAETRSLFAQMGGRPRLMAELAYGSGLRLMELLRLRVHHLDLERHQLSIRGGKGDRVNGFANAVG